MGVGRVLGVVDVVVEGGASSNIKKINGKVRGKKDKENEKVGKKEKEKGKAAMEESRKER